LLRAEGRNRSELHIAIGPNSKPVNADTVAAYRDCGVDQLVVALMAGNTDGLRRRIDAVRSVVGL